jgi:hypothetical protein
MFIGVRFAHGANAFGTMNHDCFYGLRFRMGEHVTARIWRRATNTTGNFTAVTETQFHRILKLEIEEEI